MFKFIYPYYNYKSEEPNLISSGMRILRASDGVNTMVCDEQSIVLGLLNKTIEVYDRESLKKVITYGSSTPASKEYKRRRTRVAISQS